MKSNEAISVLLEHKKPHLFSDTKVAINIACKALEKQIPKKPELEQLQGYDFTMAAELACPTCNQPIVNVWSSQKYKPRYCHYCGQALDWSNTE